ncbi:SPOR domain-containing protein [uncultured Sphingomonas sp.]|uniref:SPOR domain-containing protein n=1 Tax=uncultured Sphingomonas sp. TaxID=158754 RepID=UPI0035CAE1CA
MATSSDDMELRAEDRLPWLDAADERHDDRGPSTVRLVALVALGLALLAAIILGIYWLQHRGTGNGNGALIAAQEGNYKVKPDDPGGLKVQGEGDTAVATSGGAAAGGAKIDVGALPETPVAGKRAPGDAGAGTGGRTATASVPGAGGALKATPPGKPMPSIAAGGGGSIVQLGAYRSQSEANAAWASATKRFDYLAPLGKAVERAEVGGKTWYRLRVNAGGAGAARDLCGKLKVAGNDCIVVS